VIGVACDGTGYGTDGAIWGGEFFTGGYAGFDRRAHFRYVPMAGGDSAIREPWRAALSYLMDAYGPEVPFAAVPEERSRVVRRMLLNGVNTWQTSSCGRLFDAVASLAGIRQQVNFEGQAAIELEAAAAEEGEPYPFAIEDGILDFRPAIRALVEGDESSAVVSARFHQTVAAAIAAQCDALAKDTGLGRVCLSGGTFQNWRLLGLVLPLLRREGLDVYLHSRVPPNDGGIALGQAVIAAAAFGIE
jgi:hydrogenase maturation protein HypF